MCYYYCVIMENSINLNICSMIRNVLTSDNFRLKIFYLVFGLVVFMND